MGRRVAWWVPAVNGLMRPATRRARRGPGASFGALQERAAARSGVPEPADPRFVADLRVLHTEFLSVPELSFIGLASGRSELLRHLGNWLSVREYLRAQPQVAEVPMLRPVFVVGLPRTGTTLLHALLASVPGHRAARMWELLAPVPASAGQPHPGRPVRDAERLAKQAHLAAPSLRVIHPVDACAPEECVFAMPHSMVYHVRARIPGYRDWYAGRDATADYVYLRQQLQILQWQRPAHRWILKSPFHLWNLDALLRVFPDATIVWTHRDPAVALASWCSFVEIPMTLSNRRVDRPLLGRDWAQMWAQANARGTQARARSQVPFIDVSYQELCADPVSVLDEILRGLGTTMGPQARDQAITRARRRARGVHHYSLDRYGLSPRTVRDAFPDDI